MKALKGLLPIFVFIFAACSHLADVDTSTAEGAFKKAQLFEEASRFQEAISQYNTVKNKFPYHKLATEAELKIADIEFERQNFIEAQYAYELFKSLHPKHPKIDYVIYRQAMSLFNQIPEVIARDLSAAPQAIDIYDELIMKHPNSEYIARAKDYRQKTLDKLAQKELYIADFYYKRETFSSALGRYENIIRQFPDVGLRSKALYRASYSALKAEQKDKARLYYNQLIKEYPKSSEAKKAKDIANELR
ncbi:MAG: outer membrane protein assembly factor BamD [Bdellovibrionales bacterium]|nr:outer membrane protein assembly factor BamD [Bdellovibrionales bacterium]